MIASPIGRWALWGTSPAGRYLLERQQVCDAFPLAAIGGDPRRPQSTDWAMLLADPSLTGIVLAVAIGERVRRLCEALAAGKTVLVEGWPCLAPAELARIDAARRESGREIGVIFTQPVEADFQSAQAACRSGRLGVLRQLTWIGCEFALRTDDHVSATDEDAAGLLRRFLELTGELPDTVQAWIAPESLGIQLRLTCPFGMTAWLELHRKSLSGLRTGWVLEGSQGAYRQGRIMTVAADGELRDEAVAAPTPSEDVWIQLLRLAEDPAARQASWLVTVETIRLLEGVRSASDER